MTAKGPFVSVVMPVYDGERFLRDAIESVLAQTYPNFELVIVDDGSRDSSFRIAQEYAARDPRVRPLRNEHNLGIVKTRNRAFAEASREAVYFAVLDADDVCEPTRLEHQVLFLEHNPDHALVGGHTLVINEEGRTIGQRRYPTEHRRILAVIARYNPIAQPTVMIRRSALEAVGHYDERYPRCQDYDLWLRMAVRYKLANLDEYTLKYRISAGQGKRTALRDSLRYTIQIQRRFLLRPRFFRPFNVLYFFAEHVLLVLPEPLVLAAFKRITYGQPERVG